MHVCDISGSRSLSSFSCRWWALIPRDLELFATTLVGPLPGGWVRQGNNYISGFDPDGGVTPEYVGHLSTAKNFETTPMYLLRRQAKASW